MESPTDSLELIWSFPSGVDALEYPRNLAWGPDGSVLYVSDTGLGEIHRLALDGSLEDVHHVSGVQHPYLAGWRGDTLVVLDPDERRLLYLRGREIERAVSLPFEGPETRSYLYAVAHEAGVSVKAVRRNAATLVLDLSHDGRVLSRRELEGPYWRHAGFLLARGDTILSLCGYRPMVDLLYHSGQDSILLRGFDSPMLSRSRRFILGEVEQPPLLIASARASGTQLFVLNLRPGRLRVDVYDGEGMLQHVLVSPDQLDFSYYPVDLAVSVTGSGEHLIAVSAVEPAGRVDLFRWAGVRSPVATL